MRSLTPRENKILIICGILIFVFVGYKVVFRTFQERDASLGRRIQTLEARLEKNLKILGRRESIDRAYRKFAKDKKQKFSKEQEMTRILSQIESVADQLNTQVSDMKPQKVRDGEFYNQFSVSLTIEGELVQILHFLYLLENPPYKFAIDDMILERSFGRSTKLRCRLTLSRILVP